MIDWLLFLKIDNNFSRFDVDRRRGTFSIIFKRGDSDKTYMDKTWQGIGENINIYNFVEIENFIMNLINSHVTIREKVYVVLNHENITKYSLEKMMPKLSSRIHQVIYTNV